MLSYFEASYLWGGFADPNSGWILLGVSTMLDVQKCLEWASSQSWFANARVDILTRIIDVPREADRASHFRKRSSVVIEENSLFGPLILIELLNYPTFCNWDLFPGRGINLSSIDARQDTSCSSSGGRATAPFFLPSYGLHELMQWTKG